MSLALVQPALAAERPTLARAIALYENFEDAKATRLLHELLRHAPPRDVAGKAHLYLGLIAINRLDTDTALAEFKAALLIQPTLDLIRGASPKARLAFDEARRSLDRQLQTEAAAPAAAPPPAPQGLIDVTAETPPPAPPPRVGHSHALAITLGAIGLVAAGVGTYGGIDLLTYNSAVNGTAKGTPYTPALQSARSQAGFWAVAWIPFVVAGALGLGAGVLTW
ncbi:MAG TPA: hypothetical protein VMB50_02495 [Myxococcales bacterium]|nr:hypothetical protein [Myxococcales bacterium]